MGTFSQIINHLPAGHLFGLTLSNNGSDATNDIDFAAGSARDSTNIQNLLLASALTKRLDAAWAAGTNQGGRMSAAAIADTTYHCFIIGKPDGTVDVGFDTSPTAPTLPAGYTTFRRIGSIIRASAAIVAFSQRGDEFALSVPSYASSSVGTTSSLATLRAPTGIQVEAVVDIQAQKAATTITVLITSPDQADTAVSGTIFTTFGISGAYGYASGRYRTNTAAQVRQRSDTAATSVGIVTRGWIDSRGRLN